MLVIHVEIFCVTPHSYCGYLLMTRSISTMLIVICSALSLFAQRPPKEPTSHTQKANANAVQSLPAEDQKVYRSIDSLDGKADVTIHLEHAVLSRIVMGFSNWEKERDNIKHEGDYNRLSDHVQFDRFTPTFNISLP